MRYFMAFALLAAPASCETISSPDGRIAVQFQTRPDAPVLSVAYRGKIIVREIRLGFELDAGGTLQTSLVPVDVAHRSVDKIVDVPFGKTSRSRDRYDEASFTLQEAAGSRRRLQVVVRVSNDGVAFRYGFPEQDGLSDFVIRNELTRFAFAGDPKVYGLPLPFGSSYEAYYKVFPLDRAEKDSMFGLPMLLQYPRGPFVAVTEASLTDYAGLYLAPDGEGALRARLAPSISDPAVKVRAKAPFLSPWRVMFIGATPAALIESNLVYNLNEPSKIPDVSWIKPGKVQFPWWSGYYMPDAPPGFHAGLNTDTLKRYIDFCAEHGIPYQSIDGFDKAWYGGLADAYDGSDPTHVIPEIDMPVVLAYAKQRGVQIRLWLHWKALAQHDMDHTFATYEAWGISGIMVDFINRDDQEMMRFITEVTKKAAEHHLTVNFHGISKPTGIQRTYPNLLSYESVLGTEYNKFDGWPGSTPEHELLLPFVRKLAGPLDVHQGSFTPVAPERFQTRFIHPETMGTLMRQLAIYVVYENPLAMVADAPASYKAHLRAFQFVRDVPTTWDQTKVVGASVGRWITIARRKGADWWVGTITDRSARTVRIPLRFLGKGTYIAQIYGDERDSGRYPERYRLTTRQVTASDVIVARLAPAGGHAIRFTPYH